MTKTTRLKLNLLGRLSQYNTNNGMDGIITTLYNLPSAAFPIRSAGGSWSQNSTWSNPIAKIASTGFTQVQDRALYNIIAVFIYADGRVECRVGNSL